MFIFRLHNNMYAFPEEATKFHLYLLHYYGLLRVNYLKTKKLIIKMSFIMVVEK